MRQDEVYIVGESYTYDEQKKSSLRIKREIQGSA